MNDLRNRWDNGVPIPEAVTPPIFPEYTKYSGGADPSPYIQEYRRLDANLGEQLRKDDLLIAERIYQTHIRAMHPPYPAGTLIPLSINGVAYLLVMASGHTSAHGQPIQGTTKGWEFWVPKAGGQRAGRHSQRLLEAGGEGNRWFAGIHQKDYPGDQLMEALFATNLAWTGFYLGPTLSHPSTSWMPKLPKLKSMGWCVVPLNVGWQVYQPGRLSEVANRSPQELGKKDGQDAATLAKAAGFMTSVTIVYLDIENNLPGDRRAQEMVDYWCGWATALMAAGYWPGVYCSPSVAQVFMAAAVRPWRVWAAYFPHTGYVGFIQHPFPL